MGQRVGVRPIDPSSSPPGTTQRLAAAWRAATLDERLAALANSGLGAIGSESLARRERWIRLFAGGDAAAFERRLSWDGLGWTDVARALDDTPPPGFVAEWTSWLPTLVDEMTASENQFRSGAWERDILDRGGTTSVPFADAWLPWARTARVAIASRLKRPERLAEPAWASIERQVLSDLAQASAAVMLEAFRGRSGGARAADHASTAATGYDAFIRGWLTGGLEPLVAEYPALVRHLVWLLISQIESAVDWGNRFEADRDDLAALLGLSITTIADVSLGLSDRHGGGRTVVVLQVDQGRRVVYKPRDLRLDAAYHALLTWLRDAGLDAVPTPLRVLSRAGYGWTEYAQAVEQWEAEAVPLYYRRAGGLLCVAHLLGARDLHGENVVASAEGPTLIDLEALVQPSRSTDAEEGVGGHSMPTGADGRDEPAQCCLATGLLTLRHQDAAGAYYDIGGLRESTPRTAEIGRMCWIDLRTDGIRCEVDRVVCPQYGNAVRVNGAWEPPERHREAIVGGFEDAYRLLVRRRPDLLAQEWPLAEFRGATTRVLFRSSDRYAALLHVLLAPAHWRSGADRSIALDTLNRVFSREPIRPLLWPLVADERRALEQGDLPRFAVPTTSRDLCSSSGERVEGHFALSGVNAVSHRLRQMDSEDLARQLAWLRAALTPERTPQSADVVPPLAVTARAGETRPLIRAAERLGHDLLRHALSTPEGGLEWPVLGPRLESLWWGFGRRCVLRGTRPRARGRVVRRRPPGAQRCPRRGRRATVGKRSPRPRRRDGDWFGHLRTDGEQHPARDARAALGRPRAGQCARRRHVRGVPGLRRGLGPGRGPAGAGESAPADRRPLGCRAGPDGGRAAPRPAG